MKKIEFIDTTLRDGQQSPLLFDANKYLFSLEDKKLIIEGLVKLGVSYFEFFSLVVGGHEADEFKEIKKFIKSINRSVMFLCHCRCVEKDIELAMESGFDGLNLYFGTSPQATLNGHRKSLETVATQSKKIISSLRKTYPELYLRFSGEDAFRTDLKDLYKVYDELSEYCQTFGTPDTVGKATPAKVTERIKALKARYPNKIECHFHNDRGFALINALTAAISGADFIDTAIWGLAERSGITSVTGLLLNLYLENPEYVKGYELKNAYPLNVLLGGILKMDVPYDEPVSLTNRTHIAGVHTSSVLNSKSVYEGIDLALFGVNASQLLLGPLSGWNLISYYLREVKNYEVSDDAAKQITQIFKNRSKKISEILTPEMLLIEIAEEYGLPKVIIPIKYDSRRIEILR